MEWYYANNGNRVGPVKASAFETLVADGTVKPATLVWANGMAEWQAWSAVAGETAVCRSSGGRYFKRDMVPYEGGFIANEHKDEFFQRLREGVVQPGQLVYAGFWVRFGAKVIDGIITGIVGQIINVGLMFLFFGGFLFTLGPEQIEGNTGKFFAYQAASMLANTLMGLAYYYFFLARFQATPGKMALGLKVVRADGSRLAGLRIVGRFFSEWISGLILGIGYMMAGWDEEKRALHDRICDTRVVRSR